MKSAAVRDSSPPRYARRLMVASMETQHGFLETVLAFRIGLWLRDADLVSRDLAAFEGTGIHGNTAELVILTIRAGLAGLRGPTDEALPLFRRAAEGWRTERLDFMEALLGIDMATVLDPSHPEVASVIERSREILTRLGAAPFLARLDAETTRAGDAGPAASHTEPIPVAEPA